MASSYPGGLDTLATNKTNSTTATTDHPNHHNDLADAVNKIEAELGTDPSASDATVKARLDATDSVIDRLRRRFEFWNDFIAGSLLSNGDPLVSITNGTGASSAAVTTPDAGTAGVIDQGTGTTTTGRYGLRTAVSAFLFGGGRARFGARVRFPTLSDVTETYQYRAGFGDADAASHTDGAYLEYDQAASGNVWRCVTANGATRTTTVTAVAVSAATWARLEIDVNAAGTSVDFKIDGTVVATHTANIPTAAGREFAIGSWIVKSAGTTARTVQMDYLGASIEFTTLR